MSLRTINGESYKEENRTEIREGGSIFLERTENSLQVSSCIERYSAKNMQASRCSGNSRISSWKGDMESN